MGKKVKVTLVRSVIGRPQTHRKILLGMGLKKLNKSVDLQDTPAVRGMINKVSHLVNVEEINNEAQ